MSYITVPVSASVSVPETVPYPWPYDGRLAAERLAVVVLGAQRGLVAASHDAAEVASTIAALVGAARSLGGPIIWVRHGRVPARPCGPSTLLPDRASPAWAIESGLGGPLGSDSVIDAFGWDGCFGGSLDAELRARRVTAVSLAGFASELTVDSTVRTLNDRGHECLVLTDACAPIDPDLGRHAHHSLTMSGGIFGALGTTTSLLGALRATPGQTGASS